MIAALMVATLSANAQQMFIKPMAGMDLTTFTGDVDDTKMKVGLVAGAEFGYNLSEQFGLTAGLLYSIIKAGIQPGFLMSAKYGDVDTKDAYKSFDLSVPLGLSYEISDFVIDARYNLGVSNIMDKDLSKALGDPKVHNSVIMLTVGYKIPF